MILLLSAVSPEPAIQEPVLDVRNDGREECE